MTILKTAIATAALISFAGAAQAQDGNAYGAIGVSSYEFDMYGVEAKLGYNFNDYFGVEGQAGVGVISDKETVAGTEVKTSVSHNFAGFGVVRFPASEQFDLFARAGYHTTRLKASTGGVSVSGSDDGFAFGGGGQFNINDRDGIRLEYTNYDFDGGNADVVSASYVRKF